MVGFLKNCWYVGAWTHEFADNPKGRTLLDQPVVFFRDDKGKAIAMHDRCPHRFVPLSLGHVENGEIVCPYHGLAFNSAGRCTTPRACDVADQFPVRTYPVVERYGAAWIWMGDPGLADPALIPDFDFFDDPDRITVGQEVTYLDSNYTLEIDNLLDLTHVDCLHTKTIANVPMTRIGEYEMRREGDAIHSNWTVYGTPAPLQYHGWIEEYGHPFWEGDAKDSVELWIDVRWNAASNILVNAGIAPLGKNREAKIEVPQGHFITPETENSSFYFWSNSLPDLGTPKDALKGFLELARTAFEQEDLPMLSQQKKAMKSNDFWAERPMILKEDAGAIRVRRTLDKMIREESVGASETSDPVAEPAE